MNWKDRAFWTIVVDTLAALVAFVIAGNYMSAEAANVVKVAWGMCQPFIAYFIAKFTVETAVKAVKAEMGLMLASLGKK
jgi:hypothetical protein